MRIQILETNVLHASAVLYWLDGTSDEDPAKMLRVPAPLALQLTTRPEDLRIVHRAGKTALLRRPTGGMVVGIASEADRQPPVTDTFTVAGVVSDPAGRFNPRRFSVTAGNASGHTVVVYPSPSGSAIGLGGGLVGTLRFQATGAPAPWSLLKLDVTPAVGPVISFRCQADRAGDFVLPLQRLPTLPEGIEVYQAALSVRALTAATPATPLDPADLTPMRLGSLESDDSFAESIPLQLIPGGVRLLRSSSKEHLAISPP